VELQPCDATPSIMKNDSKHSFEMNIKKEERKGFLEKSFTCFCLSRSN